LGNFDFLTHLPINLVFLLLNFTIHQDRITADAKIPLADIVRLKSALLIHHDCSSIGAFDLQIDLLYALFFKVYQEAFEDSSR